MKWNTPNRYVPWPWEHQPGMPREGTTRTRIVFAWFPMDCGDGSTRWFERVKFIETFGKCYFGIRLCYSWGWKITATESLTTNLPPKQIDEWNTRA